MGNTEREIIDSQSSQQTVCAVEVEEEFLDVFDTIEDESCDDKLELKQNSPGKNNEDPIVISDDETIPDSKDAADDTKTDTNENITKALREPLRIHMKANGDDNDLDTDLSHDEPKVIEFSGGFGFFVN